MEFMAWFREKMGENINRVYYEIKPDAPIFQKEFGYYCLDRWKTEGHIDDNTDLNNLFGYDDIVIKDF